jgi:hypothetical protein
MGGRREAEAMTRCGEARRRGGGGVVEVSLRRVRSVGEARPRRDQGDADWSRYRGVAARGGDEGVTEAWRSKAMRGDEERARGRGQD